VLLFNVNMKQFSDPLYSSREKIEHCLKVRVACEKREAIKALAMLQSQLNTNIGDSIELDIDWSFALTEEFLRQSMDDYSKIIQSIWKTGLPRLVNGNDS